MFHQSEYVPHGQGSLHRDIHRIFEVPVTNILNHDLRNAFNKTAPSQYYLYFCHFEEVLK